MAAVLKDFADEDTSDENEAMRTLALSDDVNSGDAMQSLQVAMSRAALTKLEYQLIMVLQKGGKKAKSHAQGMTARFSKEAQLDAATEVYPPVWALASKILVQT